MIGVTNGMMLKSESSNGSTHSSITGRLPRNCIDIVSIHGYAFSFKNCMDTTNCANGQALPISTTHHQLSLAAIISLLPHTQQRKYISIYEHVVHAYGHVHPKCCSQLGVKLATKLCTACYNLRAIDENPYGSSG